MGFVRKAAMVGTLGGARVAGVRGKSKKERNAVAEEKMAKIEGKRFKAEQKQLKAEHQAEVRADRAERQAEVRADRAERDALKAEALAVQPATDVAPSVQASPSSSPLLAPQGPPPGWYQDPDAASGQRWWDGTGWTDVRQVAEAMQQPVSVSSPVMRLVPGLDQVASEGS